VRGESVPDTLEHVRRRYAEAADRLAASGEGSCCPSCPSCGHTSSASGLGCGDPVPLAGLLPGETVLDLGSGPGIDALRAAAYVRPGGRVWGVDATPEMVALAGENARREGVGDVEFLEGDMESLPLPDGCVDVVISNCVINLARDKDRVFAELVRVLRPGGRLVVADTVFRGDVDRLPAGVASDPDAWAGCVSGSLEERDYVRRLQTAGLVGISLVPLGTWYYFGERLELASALVRAYKPGSGAVRVRPAERRDGRAVLRLLRQAGLPLTGVSAGLGSGFVVAGSEAGQVVGSAGLETYGAVGLVRSVAVDPAWRGCGVGRQLVSAVEDLARNRGVRELYLLTTDAAAYFERLGFRRRDRADLPADVAARSAAVAACPATAEVLARDLSG